MKKTTGILLLLTLLLNSIGLIFVLEASAIEAYNLFADPYFFVRQHALGLLAGSGLLIIALILPARTWLTVAPALMVVGMLSLLLVFVPGIGKELNGARRWIELGPLTLQPVEFFKFACIVYLAAWLPKIMRNQTHDQKQIYAFFSIVALISILLLLQPDLGSLLIVITIAGSMYFVSGAPLGKLLLAGALAVPLLIGLIMLSPYRRDRMLTYLQPSADLQGKGYHVHQITLALARGGVLGQGIGNSSQKYLYIPEASTDSIFAIVGEEVGFVGSSLLVIGFITFFTTASIHILAISDPRLKLLGFGIISWLAAQTILNLAAIVALVPLTGLPLPFFSYGRSAQLMVLLATGVLIKLPHKQDAQQKK